MTGIAICNVCLVNHVCWRYERGQLVSFISKTSKTWGLLLAWLSVVYGRGPFFLTVRRQCCCQRALHCSPWQLRFVHSPSTPLNCSWSSFRARRTWAPQRSIFRNQNLEIHICLWRVLDEAILTRSTNLTAKYTPICIPTLLRSRYTSQLFLPLPKHAPIYLLTTVTLLFRIGIRWRKITYQTNRNRTSWVVKVATTDMYSCKTLPIVTAIAVSLSGTLRLVNCYRCTLTENNSPFRIQVCGGKIVLDVRYK